MLKAAKCSREFYALAFALIITSLVPEVRAGYIQANLTSDGAVPAANTDPNLKNPWGMSFGLAGPIWVSDQVTGVSTLYDGTGKPLSLVVNIPGGSPTGQVFNSTSDFKLSDGNPAFFLFATLGGKIAGWNPGAGNQAEQVAAAAGSVFTGLTMANNGSGNLLYAANALGGIQVFDKNFQPVTLSGNFSDNTITTGYTPYNVQIIDGKIYVTYAKFGAGGGFVDQFDLNGNLLARVASNGPLNAPWGMVLAPSIFGQFAGDLLIGNLFDGRISAFDPNTFAFLGQLTLADGTIFSEPGLWALAFGNGTFGTDKNALYFTAGINGEQDGLFGSITSVPEPSSIMLGAVASASIACVCRLRKGRRANT